MFVKLSIVRPSERPHSVASDLVLPYFEGGQWLIGRVFDSRSLVVGSSLTGITALCPSSRHINPCLVLVKPRKTHPDITEKVLTWT